MSAFLKQSPRAVRPAAALVCALALAGCGTSRHVHAVEDEELSSAPPPPASRPAAPPLSELVPEPSRPTEKAFGARYATPAQCEMAARSLIASSRDKAWSALRSCVERTHFTLLNALLGDAWAEELRVRPDAAPLLAQVVAKRGGSVEGELRLLHDRKVPIFGLAAAIAQPDTYKGRYLLLRAQVADVRNDGAEPTVWLVEQGLESVERDQPVGATTRDEWTSTRSDSGGRGAFTERGTRSVTLPRYDNVSDETGREALGRLAKVDPFFSPGKDFVVLARFDGLRVTSSGGEEAEEDAPKLPVLSIVGYYAPHPLVVY